MQQLRLIFDSRELCITVTKQDDDECRLHRVIGVICILCTFLHFFTHIQSSYSDSSSASHRESRDNNNMYKGSHTHTKSWQCRLDSTENHLKRKFAHFWIRRRSWYGSSQSWKTYTSSWLCFVDIQGKILWLSFPNNSCKWAAGSKIFTKSQFKRQSLDTTNKRTGKKAGKITHKRIGCYHRRIITLLKLQIQCCIKRKWWSEIIKTIIFGSRFLTGLFSLRNYC